MEGVQVEKLKILMEMARDVFQPILTEEVLARKVAVVRIHHLQLLHFFADRVDKQEKDYSAVFVDLVYNSVGFLMPGNWEHIQVELQEYSVLDFDKFVCTD